MIRYDPITLNLEGVWWHDGRLLPVPSRLLISGRCPGQLEVAHLCSALHFANVPPLIELLRSQVKIVHETWRDCDSSAAKVGQRQRRLSAALTRTQKSPGGSALNLRVPLPSYVNSCWWQLYGYTAVHFIYLFVHPFSFRMASLYEQNT